MTEQNGLVEHKHQHCALLFRSCVPSAFWCYALEYAIYLVNITHTPFVEKWLSFRKIM